jgi:hypothetical protein
MKLKKEISRPRTGFAIKMTNFAFVNSVYGFEDNGTPTSGTVGLSFLPK